MSETPTRKGTAPPVDASGGPLEGRRGSVRGLRWEPPAYRVVGLDCEITAYAPDDEPLF